MVIDTKNSASRRIMIRSSTQSTASSIKSSDDQSNWPQFAEEDYIVFCFGDDGEFDVVKDVKSEAANRVHCRIDNSPRSVNRKLNYGQNKEAVLNRRQDEVLLDELGIELNPRYQKLTTYDKEVIEEEITDTWSPSVRKHGEDQIEGYEEHKTVSVESNDSIQSEQSTGSFAFPILGWEWTGSPVQMPKSENLNLRKHRSRLVPFHCFRFFVKN